MHSLLHIQSKYLQTNMTSCNRQQVGESSIVPTALQRGTHSLEEVENSNNVITIDININNTTMKPSTSVDEQSLDGLPEDSASTTSSTMSDKWTWSVHRIHAFLLSLLRPLVRTAATNPRRTVAGIAIMSLVFLVTGLMTNFRMELDEGRLWTPRNSLATHHSEYIADKYAGKGKKLTVSMIFHADGANVLGKESLQRMFDVLNDIQEADGYETFCGASRHLNDVSLPCSVWGAVKFWDADETLFHQQVQTDQDALATMSASKFPDGIPVSTESIFGHPVRDEETGLLKEAKSYTMHFMHPRYVKGSRPWGSAILQELLNRGTEWEMEDGKTLRMELLYPTSFSEEFVRAILVDIPLVPVIFVIMSVFTCMMFSQWHKVRSRSLLGLSAVVAVMFSVASAYGVAFLRGVPLTSITQLLPFVLFGIGLDDAFVIMGSYERTDGTKEPVERIMDTLNDIGTSITITTLTSTLAFGLGCVSKIPAVTWLCQYAFPAVIFIYLYQLTFFVACIVLDEQRIIDNRRDCCTCFTVEIDPEDQGELSRLDDNRPSSTDRLMVAYGEFLLKPWIKVVVVCAFATLSALCAMSASELRQSFDITDLLPDDSYVSSFLKAEEAYQSRKSTSISLYFRDVDQSDPKVQQQMSEYVHSMVEGMDVISNEPDYFWLDNLKTYVSLMGLQDKPFNEQVDSFLSMPLLNQLHGGNIVRDADGNVITSRVSLNADSLDLKDIHQQIETLKLQREITNGQFVNAGKNGRNLFFFAYASQFKLWEFFASCVSELVVTSVIGVGTVTLVALLLIPHWTAAPIVFPMMCILYIDMLGVMQWAGVTINVVSFIILVMSIGLLVDFLMHVLLRYYELSGNRLEKTMGTLQTMGSSVLLGGITTFLGTLPLLLSSSHIFYTVFVAFSALVVLGVSHGLILLPVILSTIGTEQQVSSFHNTAGLKTSRNRKRTADSMESFDSRESELEA